MLNDNNIKYSINKDQLPIKKGNYLVMTDIILSPEYNTLIEKGTIFNIDNNINICIQGNLITSDSQEDNVVLQNLDLWRILETFQFLDKTQHRMLILLF